MRKLAYSVAEFATALGLSRGHVYKLIDSGEIPARRFGRRLLISAKTLHELLGDDEEGRR